jgi:hypothetical protein
MRHWSAESWAALSPLQQCAHVRDRVGLYGAVAGGLPGVKKAFDICWSRLGQPICPITRSISPRKLGPDFLWREDWTQNR